MKLYTQYALVALLAVAPVIAEDNNEASATTEVVQQEESTQPKTFWDKCYQYRYHIGVGALAVVVLAYACCSKAKNVNLPLESLKPESQSTPNFPVDPAQLSDKDAHELTQHIVEGQKLAQASADVVNAPSTTDNAQTVQTLQDTPVTGTTNVNADMVATVKAWRDSAVSWLYAKRAELAADWNKVEPMSLEKLAYYAKPLERQNK